MMAQNPQSQSSNKTQFNQEIDEWEFDWTNNRENKKTKTITYCLIRDSEDIPDDSDERIALNLAMTGWDLEIDWNLKPVLKNQNPDITVEFLKSQKDNYLSKNNVLAYAQFPGTPKEGKIIFNDNDYEWSLDGKPKSDSTGGTIIQTYNLLHTLMHEIGHSLGLVHSYNNQSVMYDSYNGKLQLSNEDIERIVSKYGKRIWDKPQHYDRMKNWHINRLKRFLD